MLNVGDFVTLSVGMYVSLGWNTYHEGKVHRVMHRTATAPSGVIYEFRRVLVGREYMLGFEVSTARMPKAMTITKIVDLPDELIAWEMAYRLGGDR